MGQTLGRLLDGSFADATGKNADELFELIQQQDLAAQISPDTLLEAMCSSRAHALDFANFLIRHPSMNVNARHYRTGKTALHVAAETGHDECIQLLLQHDDISVNIKDNDRNTALMLAARHGHTQSLGLITNAPGILVNKRNNEGETGLHLAARIRADCVTILLTTKGIDINRKNANEETAFSVALSAKRNHVVAAFLQVLDNPDARFVGKFNAALAHALNPTRIRLGEVKYTQLPIICAAASPQLEELKLELANEDADVNEVAEGGENALIVACQKGYTAHVAALLSHKKINVNVVTLMTGQDKDMEKSDYGELNALMWTAVKGHLDCMMLLLERGDGIRASLQFDNSGNYSALHLAVLHSHADCVSMLLQAEKEVHLRDERLFVYTPLLSGIHDAQSASHLIDAKALVNAVCNNSGCTALHFAAKSGRSEVVRLLISRGADQGILDFAGCTPYVLSCLEGHHAVQKILGYEDWVAHFEHAAPESLVHVNDCTMLHNYLFDPNVAKKELDARRVRAWKEKIFPLLVLCGEQKCDATKKPALKNLLQATKGTREMYKDAFDHIIKSGLGQLECSLDDFQETIIHQIPCGEQIAAISIKQQFRRVECRKDQSIELDLQTPTPLRQWCTRNHRKSKTNARLAKEVEMEGVRSVLASVQGSLLTQYSAEVLTATFADEITEVLREDVALIRFCKKHKLLETASQWLNLVRDGTHSVLDRGYPEFTRKEFRDYLPALMLVHNTALVDKHFHECMRALLQDIPAVTYMPAPTKKLQRILEKSEEYATENGCTFPFGCQYIIDTVRCCVSIPTADALLQTLGAIKNARLGKDKLEMRRIKNGHHPEAESVGGYRDVKVNLLVDFNGVRLLTEVQLVFDRVLEIKHHMHLLYACDRGDY
eukprot:GEMP01013665.1.p1 GENE.GEMP01013665.1~~GEMP01013665.1.p1  ORF type:complete len:892 (+),score=202.16 GEMP01013665.1:205-2880(+)